MTVLKDSEPRVHYSPEEEEVIAIDEALRELQFNLWGHGTPSDEAQSFFENGVLVSKNGEASLVHHAVPLGEANISQLNDWGHKRDPSKPTNVVLIAYPFSSGHIGLTHREIAHYMLDHEVGNLPPRFIVGFYNAATHTITENPEFDLSQASQAELLAELEAKKRKDDEEIAEIESAYHNAPKQQVSKGPTRDVASEPVSDVW